MGFLFIVLLTVCANLAAQNLEIDYTSISKLNRITETGVINDPPKFACGEEGLNYFIKNNLKIPVSFSDTKFVYLSFLIRKDGSVEDISVVKGIDGIHDREAIRLCKIMPRWKPALWNGRPVAVKVTLPLALNTK